MTKEIILPTRNGETIKIEIKYHEYVSKKSDPGLFEIKIQRGHEIIGRCSLRDAVNDPFNETNDGISKEAKAAFYKFRDLTGL